MPKKYTIKKGKHLHGGTVKLYEYFKKVPEKLTKYRCNNVLSTLNRFKEKEVCPETIKEFVMEYLYNLKTIEDMIIEYGSILDIKKINDGLLEKAVHNNDSEYFSYSVINLPVAAKFHLLKNIPKNN